MSRMTAYSNDVHRYVDGDMSAAEGEAFEQLMVAAPELAAQVELLEKQNAAIRASVEAPDMQLLAQMSRAAREPVVAGLWKVAAVLAILMVGFAGGYGASALSRDQAMTAAVGHASAAHSLYSVEVLHPVEVPASEKEHLDKWLSKRLGSAIQAPSMAGSDYKLIGGRLLPSGQRAAALYMYENTEGTRISLYAERRDGRASQTFEYDSLNGVSGVSWGEGEWTYVLVGGDPEVIKRLAFLVSGELT